MKFTKQSQLQPQPKKKRKTKTERQKLIDQLDQLIRDILKEQPKICVCCKKSFSDEQLQVGHFITRRVYALRWDLRNVARQCYGCNLRHNYDPAPYANYMIKTYGKDVFDELIRTKNTVKKLSTAQLRELKGKLT